MNAEPATCLKIFDRAFDDAAVQELRAIVAKTLQARPALAPGERDRKWWNDMRGLLAAGMDEDVRRALSLFCGTPLLGWCRQQLGDDLYFALNYIHFRYYDPVRRPIPNAWHFDAVVMGIDVPMLNFWIPLDDVGETAPGLTVVTEACRPRQAWKLFVDACEANGGSVRSGRRAIRPLDNVDVAQLLADEPDADLVTPRLKAGSAISFNQMHLHATQSITPEMGPRASLEVRLVPGEAVRKHRLSEVTALARVSFVDREASPAAE